MPEAFLALFLLALPVQIVAGHIRDHRLESRAQELAEDLGSIEDAVRAYRSEHQDWPDAAPAGIPPPSMAGLLPEGFSFERDGYILRWEHWPLPDGLPGRPEAEALVGVSVISDGEGVGEGAAVRTPGAVGYRFGEVYTIFLEEL